MTEDRDSTADDRRTAVERLLAKKLEQVEGVGQRLQGRALQSQRSVEAYLKAGVRPRWMERVVEVDRGIARERRRLEVAYGALRAAIGHDPERFAREWRARVQAWRFDELNELIRQHNEWYPIERDLPMDPRTGDYVRMQGRSHRRPVLGPEWVLEHFPARPAGNG